MGNRKNKILLAAVCVCLLAVTAFGTLAYFTAQGEAENTFMVAGYDPNNPNIDKDKLFSVEVRESTPDKDKNPDDEKKSDGGITYNNIAPGDTRKKDPTVYNTGKYSQWVRVKVTLTNAQNLKDILGDPSRLFIWDDGRENSGFDAAKWIPEDGDPVEVKDADGKILTMTWTYYLKDKLVPENETPEVGEANKAVLFTQVRIPTDLTESDMVKLAKFDLTVAAEAIQSANTNVNDDPDDDPQEAFGFYEDQMKRQAEKEEQSGETSTEEVTP